MQSGMLTLKPLYDVIASHPKEAGETVPLAERRFYRRAAKDLCVSLPQEQGFYLWGRFEANGLWRNIYLGKAGFGRTAHLRARLTEELHDESACLWVQKIPNEALRGGTPARYLTEYDRAMRKAGASHIVWVSDPQLSNDLVRDIEADLIETMAPRANLSRPVPPSHPQEHTHTIVRHFREEIHEARGSRFPLKDFPLGVRPGAV